MSDRRLASIAEWQRAIDAEKYPLKLANNVNLTRDRGFLPVRLDSQSTGFECFQDDAKETMSFLGISNFDHSWKHSLGFRWTGQPGELDAAWMAATAYAAATGGIIFDHHEGKVFSPQQARETVRGIIRDGPTMKKAFEEIKRRFMVR